MVSEAPQNNEELRMARAAHTLTPLPQLSRDVADWVNSVRELTQPRAVHCWVAWFRLPPRQRRFVD